MAALLALAGCGSGTHTNVVSVGVSPAATTVIVSQSVTFVAIISGTTNTNVSKWDCTYATTSTDSAGKSTTGSSNECIADTGTIPANSTNTTVVFTAPSKVPDPTKIAGNNCTSSSQSCLLIITITATAAADTKKTGKAQLTLDSGIAVSVTPPTASVPTNEQQPFSATLTNDLQGLGVTWLITQQVPTSTRPYPSLATCSPGCGSITPVGLYGVTYTAPSTVPTATTPASTSSEPTVTSPSTLVIVATSKSDATRYTVASITIIQGGPITFNGIAPTIAPQGAAFYDILLDAPFISSASTITIKGKNTGSTKTFIAESGQVKVLFPIATTKVTSPASTGARLRLFSSDLDVVDTYTVSVSDPAETVTNGAGPFTFDIVPVRPTSVASIPDSTIQNGTQNDLRLTIDGGYFGSGGSLAPVVFQGDILADDTTVSSSSRQLSKVLPSAAVNSALPGLYPLSVARTTLPLPSNNNPSVTNIAVFPDYSTVPPAVIPGGGVAAGTNPSAVDVDSRLGMLAVAETGSNLVQFFSIANGSLSPLPCPTASCTVSSPTGLSINQTNHTVVVASSQDQSVVVLPLPCPSGFTCSPNPPSSTVLQVGAPGVTYPLTISLAGLIPSNVTPLPLPYSVGVDSDTNNAIVAFTSSANPTTAKVGFLLDLNADTGSCLPSLPSGTKPPCIHSQVTLNTGTYPQIAMVPHSHLAFVTPGGLGVVNGVDVTKSSSSFTISTVSLNSGLATVTVNVPSGQTLSLNPGNPGSVLIQGVPIGGNKTNFNGVFTILAVLSNNSFTYALNTTNASTNDSATCSTDPDQTKNPCDAFFGSPNITVGFSQTAQGIAINPITRTGAVADANATGANAPQIDFLNSLDQSITSLIFRSGCTVFTKNCLGSPELLGTSSVAFQPYTNSLVSYNPQQNQVSVSNPVTLQRYALACINADPTTCLTKPDQASQTDVTNFQAQTTLPGTNLCGPAANPVLCSVTVTPAGSTAVTLNLFGGLAVDPVTNQAFVVQSGSGTIQIINLNPDPQYPGTPGAPYSLFKAAEITELQVPTVPGALIGGIAGAVMPQGTLTSTTTDLAGVKIFGTGFDSSTVVRLDQAPIPAANVTFISGRELDVTIPHSFLAKPHRYAVDVINQAGSQSNVTDFFVIKAVDLTTACSGGNPQPSSVAIADQLPGQGFSPIAVISNSGCNNIVMLDINPQSPTFGGVVGSPIPTGTDPLGVAVSPRYGLAVVANNTDGTASILDLKTGTQKVAAVTTGTTPTGVAIDDGTGTVLITNTGNNTVSELNLALLFGSSPATSLTPISIAVDTSPIAVAIDPDRGTNSRGLAVVTAVQLISGGFPIGVLDAIDIGGATPAKSTTAVTGSVTATPTGVVFNPCPKPVITPAQETCLATPALFYATSSGGNVVTTFNPDTGATSTVHVGINPTSLAINPQTGGIMTINSASQTVSIIDSISNPFKTRSTFGLGGSPQFGVAIDQFTNMAVIADQAHNRALIWEMPN